MYQRKTCIALTLMAVISMTMAIDYTLIKSVPYLLLTPATSGTNIDLTFTYEHVTAGITNGQAAVISCCSESLIGAAADSTVNSKCFVLQLQCTHASNPCQAKADVSSILFTGTKTSAATAVTGMTQLKTVAAGGLDTGASSKWTHKFTVTSTEMKSMGLPLVTDTYYANLKCFYDGAVATPYTSATVTTGDISSKPTTTLSTVPTEKTCTTSNSTSGAAKQVVALGTLMALVTVFTSF